MTGKLQTAMNMLVGDGHRLDFSNEEIKIPSVTKGNNNFETCLQFKVSDQTRRLYMVVKVYDKIADLICREATYPVSSRCA